MKNKFIIISLAMSGFAFSQTTCSGITTKNTSCKIIVKVDSLCHYHGGKTIKVEINSVQCSGTSKSTNSQCKLKTKHESKFCHHHRNTN